MPACLSLTRKGESKPTALQVIDAELCEHLGVPVHPKLWVHGWHQYVGLGLATGHSFDQIIEEINKDIAELAVVDPEDDWPHRQLAIALYLREFYEPNAWYQSK